MNSELALLELPDEEHHATLPAGTIVYQMNRYASLDRAIAVIITARGSTNYDNWRQAVDPQTHNHLFWVQGHSHRNRLKPNDPPQR